MPPVPVPYRKKLIEVALPLEAINVASAREKSIRHGHPSTLHLWWARRPLAACRAVLFASLVDDPDSDPQFQKPDGTVDEEAAGTKRAALFNLIEDLVQWDNSNNPTVINAARAEIARCVASRKIELGELAKDQIVHGPKKGQKHAKGPVSGEGVTAWDVLLRKAQPAVVNAFLAEYAPPVLDPFCGGGSIPLEAQRLGLRAHGSDLNPVPVLITKALIEIPPKFAGHPPVNPEWRDKTREAKAATVWEGSKGLADDVRYYGQWMRDEAESQIGDLYPRVIVTKAMAAERPDLKQYVGEELTVIAWIWARTVLSPSPLYQGVHVPLASSFWLGKKPGKAAWVEPRIDRRNKSYGFEVRSGTPTASEKVAIDAGTKIGRGCKFRCILSDEPIPESHVKDQGMRGQLGSVMLAIVAEGRRERVYLDPLPEHVAIASRVKRPDDVAGIDSPIGLDKRAIWCLLYGLGTFESLYTPRQLTILTAMSDLVARARARVLTDAQNAGLRTDNRHLVEGGTGPQAYADSVATYLGLMVSRHANYCSTICVWSSHAKDELAKQVFLRQGIPMTWDFAETNPFAASGGTIDAQIEWLCRAIPDVREASAGTVLQLDASAATPPLSHPVVSTDPPYYDNVGYADLSDYFYVWLRRSLQSIHPSLFATVLTPKSQELIASPYRHDGDKERSKEFFEAGFGKAFARLRENHSQECPLTVYYAFKQSESDEVAEVGDESSSTASTGWETMLEGIKAAGFVVTGTWPIRTELVGNLKKNISALASSIVLVCRPRPNDSPLATRKQFLTILHKELPEALRNLQRGNIAPVDLAQAAIGPGMAVFTRFAKVMESDGTPMSVRTALGLINQSLDEVLAEQEGEFDADTRWALAWYEQFGMAEGPFGIAETLSKAKNTAINGLKEAGLVVAGVGKVRLVNRDELPDEWNPTTDRRLTIWETTQHLIRRLDKQGESAAAELLHQLGGMAEIARDLAYRLYVICERKKWAEDALAYNGLVIAWPELSKLAQSQRGRGTERQQELY